MAKKRLFRPRKDRFLAGVCSGIAVYTDIDPVIIRFIAVMLFGVFGLSLWVYFILWILMPEQRIK